jgi:hypothetical protein
MPATATPSPSLPSPRTSSTAPLIPTFPTSGAAPPPSPHHRHANTSSSPPADASTSGDARHSLLTNAAWPRQKPSVTWLCGGARETRMCSSRSAVMMYARDSLPGSGCGAQRMSVTMLTWPSSSSYLPAAPPSAPPPPPPPSLPWLLPSATTRSCSWSARRLRSECTVACEASGPPATVRAASGAWRERASDLARVSSAISDGVAAAAGRRGSP